MSPRPDGLPPYLLASKGRAVLAGGPSTSLFPLSPALRALVKPMSSLGPGRPGSPSPSLQEVLPCTEALSSHRDEAVATILCAPQKGWS